MRVCVLVFHSMHILSATFVYPTHKHTHTLIFYLSLSLCMILTAFRSFTRFVCRTDTHSPSISLYMCLSPFQVSLSFSFCMGLTACHSVIPTIHVSLTRFVFLAHTLYHALYTSLSLSGLFGYHFVRAYVRVPASACVRLLTPFRTSLGRRKKRFLSLR